MRAAQFHCAAFQQNHREQGTYFAPDRCGFAAYSKGLALGRWRCVDEDWRGGDIGSVEGETVIIFLQRF